MKYGLNMLLWNDRRERETHYGLLEKIKGWGIRRPVGACRYFEARRARSSRRRWVWKKSSTAWGSSAPAVTVSTPRGQSDFRLAGRSVRPPSTRLKKKIVEIGLPGPPGADEEENWCGPFHSAIGQFQRQRAPRADEWKWAPRRTLDDPSPNLPRSARTSMLVR